MPKISFVAQLYQEVTWGLLTPPPPQPFNVQKNPNQNMVNLIVSGHQHYPVPSLQVHKTS